jgi:hypothetical protein
MKSFFGSHIKKWYATLALASFFAAAVFSVGTGMNMDDMGNMSPCAFMSGGAMICPMGVAEHIDEWSGLFAPVSSGLLAFLFAVVLFAVIVFPSFFTRDEVRWRKLRLYARDTVSLKSLYFLVFLFSRGILNSRRYKFAII